MIGGANSAMIWGLEQLTLDWLSNEPVEIGSASGIATAVGREERGVWFPDKSQWEQAQTAVRAKPHRLEPGGCVANALVAARIAFQELSQAHYCLGWTGPADASVESELALRSLVDAGIFVRPLYQKEGSANTLCTLSSQSVDTTILVRPGVAPHIEARLDDTDGVTIVVGLDTLRTRPTWARELLLCRQNRVVLSVNHRIPAQASGLEWIRRIAEEDRFDFASGSEEEVRALVGVLGFEDVRAALRCDVVMTRGRDGAVLLTRQGNELSAPSLVTPCQVVDTLGAGDTVLGTALCARMVGCSPKETLEFAMRAAAKSVVWRGARPLRTLLVHGAVACTPLDGLTEQLLAIRTHIDRGMGVTVLSGGHTGADEIALQVAARNGLPGHALFPSGWIRESAPLDVRVWSGMGEPALHLLHPADYRARTWACCQIADGILLFDFVDSSGSRECRLAAATLGRPLFEGGEPESVARALVERGVRVLDVAGHRGSLLTVDMAQRVRTYLQRLYPAWAAAWADRETSCEEATAMISPSQGERLVVAVPNSGPMSRYVLERLAPRFPTSVNELRRLRVTAGDLEIVLCRPRDMPHFLREGVVDAVIAGRDELIEGGYSSEPLIDTGLFSSSVVLLDAGPRNGELAHGPVVTQIPVLARTLLKGTPWERHSLLPVAGAAETWMDLGLSRLCVDTWHTGMSATAAGLTYVRRLGATSLVIGLRSESFHGSAALAKIRSQLAGPAPAL